MKVYRVHDTAASDKIPNVEQAVDDRDRIEEAFQKYIHRRKQQRHHRQYYQPCEEFNKDGTADTNSNQVEQEFEVIVCRERHWYFFCRSATATRGVVSPASVFNRSLTYLMIRTEWKIPFRRECSGMLVT
jgi:hypothetical protein